MKVAYESNYLKPIHSFTRKELQ